MYVCMHVWCLYVCVCVRGCAGFFLRLVMWFDRPSQGLHMPLMCVIDYAGFRLTAMSVLPISASTLLVFQCCCLSPDAPVQSVVFVFSFYYSCPITSLLFNSVEIIACVLCAAPWSWSCTLLVYCLCPDYFSGIPHAIINPRYRHLNELLVCAAGYRKSRRQLSLSCHFLSFLSVSSDLRTCACDVLPIFWLLLP